MQKCSLAEVNIVIHALQHVHDSRTTDVLVIPIDFPFLRVGCTSSIALRQQSIPSFILNVNFFDVRSQLEKRKNGLNETWKSVWSHIKPQSLTSKFNLRSYYQWPVHFRVHAYGIAHFGIAHKARTYHNLTQRLSSRSINSSIEKFKSWEFLLITGDKHNLYIQNRAYTRKLLGLYSECLSWNIFALSGYIWHWQSGFKSSLHCRIAHTHTHTPPPPKKVHKHCANTA